MSSTSQIFFREYAVELHVIVLRIKLVCIQPWTSPAWKSRDELDLAAGTQGAKTRCNLI
jgi:hypothetical protein